MAGIIWRVSQTKEVGKKALLRFKGLFVEQWEGFAFALFERSLQRVVISLWLVQVHRIHDLHI